MTDQQSPADPLGVENEQIIARLNLARDKLVDKNLRNRLISANLTSSRTKSLRIFNGDTAGLFVHFHEKKKGAGFQADEDSSSIGESGNSFSAEPHPIDKQTLLQTRIGKDSLQKKLKALYFEAREHEEEQGVNILYLALGFIKWFESENSDIERYAPILLLPVELSRDGAKDKYRLEPRDEDLFENVSFKLWVKEQNNIDLPEVPEHDDWTYTEYVESVRTAISKETRWTVLENEALLGFFSFNKFLLWRDLQPENWPKADQLLQHPIVKTLLMPPRDGTEPEPPVIPADDKIDDHFTPADLVYVVDADSSQTEAIQTVLSGRNVVIQGPPGTGKSQTITNIISGAIHKGWKVLFIAEKMAALEVVESRLSSTGLGVTCLQLHSRKSTKSAVLEQIRESIEYPGIPAIGKSSIQSLVNAQDFLNGHSARMNTARMPWGFTPFEILGEIEKSQRLGLDVFGIVIPNAEKHSKASLGALSEQLCQLRDRLLRSGVPAKHPWKLSTASTFTPMDLEDLRRNLLKLAECSESLGSHLADLTKTLSIPSTDLRSLKRNDWCDLFSSVKRISLPSSIPTAISDSESLASSVTHLRALKNALSNYKLIRNEVDNCLIPGWRSDEIRSLRTRLAGSGGSIFSFLNAQYRASIADYKGLSKGAIPDGFKNRVALLDKALSLDDLRLEISKIDETVTKELGALWAQEETDLAIIQYLIEWFELWPTSDEQARAVIRAIGSNSELKKTFLETEENITRFYDSLETFCEAASIDYKELSSLKLEELSRQIGVWQQSIERFNEWPSVRGAIEKLEAELGDGLSKAIWNGTIQPDMIEQAFRYSVLQVIWRKLAASEPDLSEIDAIKLDTELKRFRELDKGRLEESAQQVLSTYGTRTPKGSGGEMAIVRQELVKKRNVLPVRKLLDKAGRAIQELKPVFLMSPLSVAQFVSPGNLTFDLVLIDEASQVRPEDAIGAIARARQVVVVGDSKQLPPTNFFNKLVDEQDTAEILDDDGAYFLNDVESILALCDGVLGNNIMLRWHYRSLHPGLIAVSNRNFYDGKLLLPPSVLREKYSDGLGISFVKSPQNGYIRGGADGGRNLLEAELIAKEVIEFAMKYPQKTLGVAAFSVTQRDAIRDLIDEYRRKNPSTEPFFSVSKKEPFFVKNLESIQGDERDVIFISVGYGRTADGRLTQTFGPLSVEGGERRLNVLISRAKERCTVFSSITSEDVKPVPGRLGINAFREFLQFAEKGYFDIPEATERGFDSDFEESVAIFLTRNGYNVQPQVGMSGFFIDIGVVHPTEGGRFLCGIECDGATYHSSRSARDRDRLRQQILESRGWRIYRIWSTDWFHRREQQEAKLLDYLMNLKSGVEPVSSTEAPASEVPKEDHQAPEPLPEVSEPPRIPVNVAYTEFSGRFTIQTPLHETPLMKLIEMVDEIVSTEGPIHQEEVARRLSRSCGLEKAGSRIQAATVKALRASSKTVAEGQFWKLRNIDTVKIRNRANVTSRTLLLPENLPPQEITLALTTVVRESVRIEESELIQSAARLFGFQRVGPDIRRVFLETLTNSSQGLTRDASGFFSIESQR